MELNKYIGAQKIIKENRYIQALFAYGIVALLKLLDEYELKEDYQECEIIYGTILFVNEHAELTEVLPTKFSEESIILIKEEFNLYGFKGNMVKDNIPYYIEEIKKMVKL